MAETRLSWREKVKTGPLNEVYSYVRWAKRRLMGERVEIISPYAPPPLSQETLCNLADRLPGHGRRYFTLALGYLAEEGATAQRRALACLRCAQALDFESTERLVLYRAVVLARSGDPDTARREIEPLADSEFTPSENTWRTQILDGQLKSVPDILAEDARWMQAKQKLAQETSIDSLLVAGDMEAHSAHWFSHARYFLAAPEVNGMTPELVARLGLHFAWGVGPETAVQAMQQAGVKCTQWMCLSSSAQ